MSPSVKNRSDKLCWREPTQGLELLAAFALPGGLPSRPSVEQAREFRREVEADPEISPAVKAALRELSDGELSKLLT